MGCGNCGSGASGKPGGCKGNGGCSTGGCNRLNVYDWLADLPLADGSKPYPVVEMTFSNGSRKEFFRNNTHHILEKGDWFAVEGVGGYDVGQVSLTGELVKLQLKKYSVKDADVSKRVLHPATEEELDQSSKQKDREQEVLVRSRAISKSLKLDMKICEVEIQADSKKGTFFYTADQRVDFRELIKLFAGDFKMKVEMKQIGARQESGKVGGIGSCGRELCCSTWLTDFKSVNTTAARYQNLSINQTKLSGQCGRLKCCLNYELDTYMDALSVFPDGAEKLETTKGIAFLAKRDIFKNLMWYNFADNNKQYPLSIDRVKEIQKMNKQGQKAEELQPVELETKESKAGIKPDMGYVNDVGQITLKNLEKNKKKKPGGGNKPQGQGNKPQGDGQQRSADRPQGKGQQQGGGGNKGNRPQQAKKPNNQPQQEGDTQQPAGDKPQQEKQQGRNNNNKGPRPNNNNNRPKPQQGDAPATEGDGSNKPQQQNRARPQQGDAPATEGDGGSKQQNRPQGNRQQGNRGPRPERRPDNRPNKPASDGAAPPPPPATA